MTNEVNTKVLQQRADLDSRAQLCVSHSQLVLQVLRVYLLQQFLQAFAHFTFYRCSGSYGSESVRSREGEFTLGTITNNLVNCAVLPSLSLFLTG